MEARDQDDGAAMSVNSAAAPPVKGWMSVGLLRVMLILWIGSTFGALANRFVPLTIEELCHEAEAVVHGKVVAMETLRDEAGRIYSRVDLTVSGVWKGAVSGETCRVVHGGGNLGETAVRAAGQVSFEIGDEVVVYLVRGTAAGEWVTVGLSQGRFQVVTEAGSGRRWVSHPFWGGAIPSGTGRLQRSGWPPARPMSLEELERRTREAKP